jgi:putative heme transporter
VVEADRDREEEPRDRVATTIAFAPETGEEDLEEAEPSFFDDPAQLLKTLVIVVVLVAAIYIAVPKIAGLEDALAKLGEARRSWILVALGATVLTFGAYVALFRGVVGDRVLRLEWGESYQITMAGLAATRLFSAGGAGGIVLTYWALRKAGIRRTESARRMVAFLILLYGVYVIALIVFGALLRVGVLPGDGPVSITVVPAAIAAAVGVVVLLIALVPGDLSRRLDRRTGDGRWAKAMTWLAQLPETMGSGIRTAYEFVRHPREGWLPIAGAIGFWASNIMILWASFKSLGVTVPLGEIVVGFFVGMAANLAPAPAGVGAVDGGLIGAFAILGFPLETVIAAVLIYRLFAFYLPVPPGIVAFFQLRRTVQRWERERQAARPAGTGAGRAGPIPTS